MDGRAIFLLGGAWGVGPDADDVDAASMRRTSLAPKVAGVFAGVLSPSPVKVTINDDEGSAAAVPSIRAFSCASLLRLFRRRSLAAFLALFLAFSILLSRLPEGGSADETEDCNEADGRTASSSTGPNTTSHSRSRRRKKTGKRRTKKRTNTWRSRKKKRKPRKG